MTGACADPCLDPVSDPAVRRSGFGGSDIGALAGVSRFRTVHDVDMEKMGLAAPLVQTEVMEWGKILEPAVIAKYARDTGRPVVVPRCPHGFQRTIRHPKYPWMFGHVDAETRRRYGRTRRGVEAKTTNDFRNDEWGEPGTNQIPGEYQLQCQHLMAITGFDVFDVPVLFGGQRFRLYTVERDPEAIEAIIELEAQEWARIQRGEYAPVDGSEGAARMLATRFSQDNGETVHATEEQEALAHEYLTMKAEEKLLGKRLEAVAQQIQQSMGEVTALVGTGFKVTWPVVKGGVSWKAVAEKLMPADNAEWQSILTGARSADTRRFTVTQKEV